MGGRLFGTLVRRVRVAEVHGRAFVDLSILYAARWPRTMWNLVCCSGTSAMLASCNQNYERRWRLGIERRDGETCR